MKYTIDEYKTKFLSEKQIEKSDKLVSEILNGTFNESLYDDLESNDYNIDSNNSKLVHKNRREYINK